MTARPTNLPMEARLNASVSPALPSFVRALIIEKHLYIIGHHDNGYLENEVLDLHFEGFAGAPADFVETLREAGYIIYKTPIQYPWKPK